MVVLLTATTAVADTVITAEEVIFCRIVSADTNFVRLKLPQGGIRMLNTRDVLEIRLSDSSRVAELAAQLPGVRVMLDSGQPVPPPAVRAEQPRQERVREARAEDRPEYAVVVETLARNALPAAMAARCRDMGAVLCACGRSNDTIFDLFREVDSEQQALRAIWPQVAMYSLYVPSVGLLGWTIGSLISFASDPCEPNPVGPTVGCIAGPIVGAAIGASQSVNLIARHRGRVNDLIRRVNRALASPP
jgi:hypothetical protein